VTTLKQISPNGTAIGKPGTPSYENYMPKAPDGAVFLYFTGCGKQIESDQDNAIRAISSDPSKVTCPNCIRWHRARRSAHPEPDPSDITYVLHSEPDDENPAIESEPSEGGEPTMSPVDRHVGSMPPSASKRVVIELPGIKITIESEGVDK
jgi:hypothetical protein